MRKTHTGYLIQQGSSNEIRVSDQNAWYVIRQVWEGSRILDTAIAAKCASHEEAQAKREELSNA